MALRFLLFRFVVVAVLVTIFDFPHVDFNCKRNRIWFFDSYCNRNRNRIWFLICTATGTANATANRNRKTAKKTGTKTENPEPYLNCTSKIRMGSISESYILNKFVSTVVFHQTFDVDIRQSEIFKIFLAMNE